jgi:NADH dehydrogenase
MKILVTGGTGFVGREIIRCLHAEGHSVRLLVRDPSSPAVRELVPNCCGDLKTGDVLCSASLQDAVEGCDAVIHLVGIISEAGHQTFENVHTRGTENIVAAAKNSGVKKFVHMSALGTRAGAVSRYHQSKWAAEEFVRGSGLDWTIFRPSIIYGPGDAFVNLFAKLIRRSPVVPVMGRGESKFQPVAVENVATAFVKSLTDPRAAGKSFDLCGPETLSLNEIVDEISAVLKRRRLKLHVPMSLARIQAALLELLFGKILRRPPPLNRDQLLMLQEDNVGDGKPAAELFALKPLRFREGIARYLAA